MARYLAELVASVQSWQGEIQIRVRGISPNRSVSSRIERNDSPSRAHWQETPKDDSKVSIIDKTLDSGGCGRHEACELRFAG